MAESADQQVVVELLAEVQQFARDMEEAANKLGLSFGKASDDVGTHFGKTSERMDEFAREAGRKGEEAGNNFAKGLILVAAAFATDFLAHIRSTIDSAAEYASRLGTLSLVTGDDPKKLQQFEFAMRSLSVSAEESQQQLSIFQRRIEEAAAKANDTSSSFHRMGLNAKDMVGKDAITNFETVAEKIAGMSSATDRTTAAMDTFGSRLGSRLLPILNQGKTSIQELMGAAEEFGANIDDKTREALEKYDASMKRAQQSTQAFFATLAGPIIPLLTRMSDAMMHLIASFEHLSENNRLVILIGALVTSFAVFEEGLVVVGSFMKGLINKELIGFIVDWGTELKIIINIVGALAVAWITNFANIRNSTKPAIDALMVAWQNFSDAMRLGIRIIQTDIAPAFDRFKVALSQAFAEFAKFIAGRIPDSFDAIATAADLIGKAIATMLDGLTELVRHLNELLPIIVALAAASGVAAVARAMFALRDAIAAVSLGTFVSEIQSLGLLLSESGGVIAGIRAVTTYLWGMAAAEIAAAPPLVLIQLLALAVAGAAYVLQTNLFGVTTALDKFGQLMGYLVNGVLATILWLLGAVFTAVGNIASALSGSFPFLNTFADIWKHIGDMLTRAADALDRWNNTPRTPPPKAGDGNTQAYDEAEYGFSFQTGTATKKKTDKPPPATYKPPDTKSTGTDKKELEAIKDSVDKAKAALTQAEDAVKRLDLALTDLGKIDSAATLSYEQMLFADRMRDANAEIVAQTHLYNVLLQAAAKARSEEAAHKKDKDQGRPFHDAARAYDKEADAAREKVFALESAADQKRREQIGKEIAYFKGIAGDPSKTYEEQVKAQEQVLALMRKEPDTQAEIMAQRLAILKSHEDERNQIQQARNQEHTAAIDALQQGITVRNATPITGDYSGRAKQARDIADATDQYAIALEKSKQATEEWHNAQETANELQRRGLQDSQAFALANGALGDADLRRVAAENAVIAALQLEDNARKQTSVAVNAVRAGLLQIAQQAAPQVVQVFKLIEEGVNPLVAIFLTLFEKSRSFWDILTIFQRIIAAIVPIFDALRPVLDLLLGVLVGIVNVFLTLYNVMATILNVFGAHLEKLRLVNTTLDDLGNSGAKPLLQIIHDLPTMNEYNAGKWSDLVAAQNTNNAYAQNANDILDQGFSQSLARFGQIIGELIAIKLILTVMQGGQLLGGGGGLLGGVSNFFNRLFGGGGSQPSSFQGGVPVFGSPDNPATTVIVDQSGEVLGTDSSPLAVQWGSITDVPPPDIPGGVSSAADTTSSAESVDASQAAANGSASTISLGKIAGGIGDIAAIYAGYKQGGIGGGISAGLGAFGLSHLLLTGGAAAGPAGLIAAGVIGLGALLFGGPHTNPHKNPDLYGSQSGTLDYGQGMANLGGAGLNGLPLYTANGQSFAEQQTIAQETGGQGEVSFLAQWIKANPTAAKSALSPQELADFTNATSMRYDKNGMVDLGNGPERYWSTLVNDANDAINKIFSNITNGAQATSGSLQDLLNHATDLNLAQMFGNGTTITPGGNGFSINSGGNTSLVNPPPVNPTLTIQNLTLGANVTAEQVKTLLQPAMDEFARQQQITARTSATSIGRDQF